MNILMYLLDGTIVISGVDGYVIELIEVRRMKAFMWVSSFKALAALYINFVSLRKDRDPKNPHDTKRLYEN